MVIKIIFLILNILIGIPIILYYCHLIFNPSHGKENFAKEKCEEQKKACSINVEINCKDATRYKTACLNTKNVMK